MDYREDQTIVDFRNEVQTFISDNLPDDWGSGAGGEGYEADVMSLTRSFQTEMAKRRWLTMAWPEEHGGLDAPHSQQMIMAEEMAYHRAPGGGSNMGVQWVGPSLMLYGTDEQKDEHLAGIADAETWWCTLYSEPGSGSDLASLQTRAVKDGDDFVVNGQKIWTSGAHKSDWMILLARTDPDAPKHKGITYFVLDMHSPGVSTRPLVNMAGTHEFNEVFFEDVRIPQRNVLGEVNRGWYGAVTTLDFERSSIGSAVGMQQAVEDIVRYAKENRGTGLSSVDRRETQLALTDRYIETQTARMISYRIVSMQNQGLIPNHEASMAKLFAMELNQRIQSTAIKVLGLHGQLQGKEAPRRGRHSYGFIRSIANTIEGGTSEIQRNIIATRGLGLPRG